MTKAWQIGLVRLVFLVLLVLTFWQIDKNLHSVSDTLYGIFVPFIVWILVWITAERSRKFFK